MAKVRLNSEEHCTNRAAIVLNDTTLGNICGANDENLRVLEDLLGVGIHSRGNELTINTEDEGTWEVFKRVIRSLEQRSRLGESLGPDRVQAIFRAASGDRKQERMVAEGGIILPRGGRRVYPKSVNQARYLEALRTSEMVFGIGPAGTGKTYLAVAHALAGVLAREKRKLILTRPVVEAGESLGYLPGDLAQKISPYLRPLYDAMENLLSSEVVRRLEENRTIEVAPLAYMRGRTLADAFVILDEAQNTTREQMKMFLTRIGFGSQAMITGDVTQIDLPRPSESGLVHVSSILRSIEQIRFVYFSDQDVVRNPLVKKIINAYEAQADSR
jgi:phosphate starvation-inducible PhoH-like protein